MKKKIIVNKVLISEDNQDIEINGSLDCQEAKQLEKQPKNKFIDLDLLDGEIQIVMQIPYLIISSQMRE